MLFGEVDPVAEAFDCSLVCSKFDSVEAKFRFGLVAEVFTYMSSFNDTVFLMILDRF